MGELVTFLVKDGVAEVVISNPPVNALNAQVIEELSEVISSVGQTGAAAVIITGAGERAFVAGADITEFPSLNAVTGKNLVLTGQRVLGKLTELDVPVIAAINGFALGGGCELALASDIRIAEEQAKLGLPEVNLGVIPGYGGTQRLSRLVGGCKAKELIFTGEAISAEEALRIGLVEKVVGQGESLNAARKMAQKIISKGPLAIKKAKRAIDDGLKLSLKEGLDLEANLFGELCETKDQKEGANAFLEKRKAEFKGI